MVSRIGSRAPPDSRGTRHPYQEWHVQVCWQLCGKLGVSNLGWREGKVRLTGVVSP